MYLLVFEQNGVYHVECRRTQILLLILLHRSRTPCCHYRSTIPVVAGPIPIQILLAKCRSKCCSCRGERASTRNQKSKVVENANPYHFLFTVGRFIAIPWKASVPTNCERPECSLCHRCGRRDLLGRQESMKRTKMRRRSTRLSQLPMR